MTDATKPGPIPEKALSLRDRAFFLATARLGAPCVACLQQLETAAAFFRTVFPL
jgi:hypothetical protein